jgi:hypothetical protein
MKARKNDGCKSKQKETGGAHQDTRVAVPAELCHVDLILFKGEGELAVAEPVAFKEDDIVAVRKALRACNEVARWSPRQRRFQAGDLTVLRSTAEPF